MQNAVYTEHDCQNCFNDPPRLYVGGIGFKVVVLLPVKYRVEQLKVGHMFDIIKVKVPAYLTTNVKMVHHRYLTKPSNLACVIPRVKVCRQKPFLYTVICHWNNRLSK